MRQSGRGRHGRALDGKARGPRWLTRMEPRGRLGAAFGTEVCEARGRPRGVDRDHGLQWRLQKSLDTKRNRGFQAAKEDS